jgi:UDP-N-acetylmuramate dehydrogenase
MSRHTSWRVGGVADRFYEPADAEDLVNFMQRLPPEEPVVWVGLGSNLLVRDGGIRGTVIGTAGKLEGMEFLDELTFRAQAGVPCAKVARLTVKAGLTGAEFLAGIPGTMGGALAMNAGAFGGETWERVFRVETLDRNGRRRVRRRDQFQVGYREVVGSPPDEWFLSADLRLERDAKGEGAERIKTMLARRAGSQPMGQPSCGSVFRNPPSDFAARLIESCGLKGRQIGDAQVSEKHANFIINRGQGTASDIERLIVMVRDTVAARRGVRLVSEVKIVGEGLEIE